MKWGLIGLLFLVGSDFWGSVAHAEFLRHTRTEIAWVGKLPKKTRAEETAVVGSGRNRPLLVYIESDRITKDQERFDNVVAGIDQFKLATNFFECVKIKNAVAEDAKFLEGLKFSAPAIIVFSADRSKHQIVKGRASAMKAVSAMRAIGQSAYKANIKKTLQKGKVLLGRYDQISDSQIAIDIKTRRWNDYVTKKANAKAAALKRDLDKDIAARDKYLAETDARWKTLWTLKRKWPKAKT
jgi:hypothetical protein